MVLDLQLDVGDEILFGKRKYLYDEINYSNHLGADFLLPTVRSATRTFGVGEKRRFGDDQVRIDSHRWVIFIHVF